MGRLRSAVFHSGTSIVPTQNASAYATVAKSGRARASFRLSITAGSNGRAQNEFAGCVDFVVRQVTPARQSKHIFRQALGIRGAIARTFGEGGVTMQAAAPPTPCRD